MKGATASFAPLLKTPLVCTLYSKMFKYKYKYSIDIDFVYIWYKNNTIDRYILHHKSIIIFTRKKCK